VAVGGLLVGVGAEIRTGLGVVGVEGRFVGVAVEPQAARPRATIALPVMVIRFAAVGRPLVVISRSLGKPGW
jgi:hypothetical protein